MRRLAFPLALALIACSIAAARATPVASAAPSGAAASSIATPAASGATLNPGSSIVLRTFRSASLQRDWSYTVYLPPGYNAEARAIR